MSKKTVEGYVEMYGEAFLERTTVNSGSLVEEKTAMYLYIIQYYVFIRIYLRFFDSEGIVNCPIKHLKHTYVILLSLLYDAPSLRGQEGTTCVVFGVRSC